VPTVNVLYFAQVRDRCGRDSDQIELPEIITPDILLAAVIAQHPAHEKLILSCRVAINHAFINAAVSLDDNCEIALIPPVSGG
jgi:molybdopterin converting factor subunit 1